MAQGYSDSGLAAAASEHSGRSGDVVAVKVVVQSAADLATETKHTADLVVAAPPLHSVGSAVVAKVLERNDFVLLAAGEETHKLHFEADAVLCSVLDLDAAVMEPVHSSGLLVLVQSVDSVVFVWSELVQEPEWYGFQDVVALLDTEHADAGPKQQSHTAVVTAADLAGN